MIKILLILFTVYKNTKESWQIRGGSYYGAIFKFHLYLLGKVFEASYKDVSRIARKNKTKKD